MASEATRHDPQLLFSPGLFGLSLDFSRSAVAGAGGSAPCRWHHLFAELLRERLAQREQAAPLLIRASEWYEAQGQTVEAFQQALAASEIDRAIRLIDGDGMPLYFRGAMAPVVQSLQGLQGLPNSVLHSHPRLWVMLAWSLMISGYPDLMAVKLQGAVAALHRCAVGSDIRDLWGQVAALKAWEAVAKHDVPSTGGLGARLRCT